MQTQSLQTQFLKTKDGSFSLYSEKYGDFYHSTKDGAILETLYKHIIPTFALTQNLDSAKDSAILDSANRAKNAESTLDSANLRDSAPQNPIKILDICFGLGYNALFSLAFAKKCGIAVKIYSVELHLLETLRDFAYPKILLYYLPLREILDSLFLRGAWESENLSLYLHKGDAKIYLQNLADSTPNAFDIIYQDAFSPTKNAELWDKSHFQNLHTLLKNHGAISTYSSNKKIRQTCQSVGFEVYDMKCGSLKNGTILAKSQNLPKIQSIFLQKITL
ncbi:tRNA (5-methylaminomethyl-2-thiouridine)(34)-methyltransferase MnmD [Helicobacter sp. 23-1044]